MNTKSFTNSSQVSTIWYREEEKELEVLFIGGKRYVYYDVHKDVWTAALSAESIGKFINDNIKGKYQYKQI